MATGDIEEVPMHPPDASKKDKTSSEPFIVFSKKRFLIIIIILVLLAVIIGVLSGVLSAKYAEERTRRELLADKEKRNKGAAATTASSITTKPTLGPEPWYQVRLPTNVVPIHYDLYLHPNLTTDTFNGNVSVLVEVNKDTEYILIHFNEMTITHSSVHSAEPRGNEFVAGKEQEVKEKMEYTENNFYVFIMKSKLKPGKYVIQMSYKGVLSGKVLNGLYLSTYKDKKLGKRKLVTTKFEPTDARKALPCFDEPAMKATFTTTIVHDNDYTALTNMPEDSKNSLPNGVVATKFQKSVPMSTYLLAFIVCDFAHKKTVTGKHKNIT
ncbi:endoplasmic reticulum aminopeptidase 2-like, partial [Actinia tenebrosa]